VHKFIDVGNEDLEQHSPQEQSSSTQESSTTNTNTETCDAVHLTQESSTEPSNMQEDWSTQATQAAPANAKVTSKEQQCPSLQQTPSYRLKMEKAMAVAVASNQNDDAKDRKDASLLSANDLAAGQLMRWKIEAEEGPCLLQFGAVLCSLASMGTTLYPVVFLQDFWQYQTWIVAVHTINLCSLILIFELRSIGAFRGPLNVRSKVRATFSRYLSVLRLLWGRGLLYIFTGTVNIAVGWKWTLFSGIALVVTGLLAIIVGARASFNLDRLKTSVTDEVYLWTKFDAVDDDGDEMIGVDAFSTLVWSLGLEINDKYTYETFLLMDKDRNGLVSFDDFKDWWLAGQEKNRNGGYSRRIIL
jgi:hypothetical protein